MDAHANDSRARDVLALLKDAMDADARIVRIEAQVTRGYVANNGDAYRYREYVDTTTMLADLRWLLDEWKRARALAEALEVSA